MPVRVATYNMENLFSRPNAMSEEFSPAERREYLKDHSTLNTLIEKETYSAATKRKLVELLLAWGFDQRYGAGYEVLKLNKIRGQLFSKAGGEFHISANGRSDWVGWFELIRGDVRWAAVSNTARVVNDLAADVIVAVEVEDRPTLQRFNDFVLAKDYPGSEFPHNVLIDGNDQRGIDIGLFSRFPIEAVRTNIEERENGKRVFSRDCPEYDVRLPSGELLVLLGNHFKSKGWGSQQANNKKRRTQAERTQILYKRALERSDLVVVGGDLNDSPDSHPIRGLTDGLTSANRLRDVMTHPSYNGTPGTYKSGNSINQKFDYLLLSPALWERVAAVGVERRGIYMPVALNPYDTVTSKETQASDHAAVWFDFET